MTWETWATAVLPGVGAPVNAINLDTLWAWSHAESGADVMRWNNPLNTTEYWPGAVAMNSVGVKRYASENDGVLATVATLDNGYYPVILANLRSSVPRAQWGNACANLDTWGTGCGWLQATYGPAPGILGGSVMYILQGSTAAEYLWIPNANTIILLVDGATAASFQQSGAIKIPPISDAEITNIVATMNARNESGGGTMAFPSGFSGTFTK
jgi:hypothetical protein